MKNTNFDIDLKNTIICAVRFNFGIPAWNRELSIVNNSEEQAAVLYTLNNGTMYVDCGDNRDVVIASILQACKELGDGKLENAENSVDDDAETFYISFKKVQQKVVASDNEYLSANLNPDQKKALLRQREYMGKCIDGSIDWNLAKVGKLRGIGEGDVYFSAQADRFQKTADALACLKQILYYGVACQTGDAVNEPKLELDLDSTARFAISNQVQYLHKNAENTIAVQQAVLEILDVTVKRFVTLNAEND